MQYFKGEETVEATHCYAVVACEGMADELGKTVHSCRARLPPCCADPPASASSSAKGWDKAPFNWGTTGEELGILFGSAWMSMLKPECGPLSEMLQDFQTNTHTIQKSQFSAAR